MTKFAATDPDGGVHYKSSSVRHYTHAIVAKDLTNNGKYRAVSWATSEGLALKAREQVRRYDDYESPKVVKAVPSR